MNEIDKRFYRALKFLSTIPTKETFGKYFSKNVKDSGKYYDEATWEDLRELGYVVQDPLKRQILTSEGLSQLRMLEDIRRKDLTLWISIIAIALSIFALLKSFGVF